MRIVKSENGTYGRLHINSSALHKKFMNVKDNIGAFSTKATVYVYIHKVTTIGKIIRNKGFIQFT